jgi:hypothetical protein
MVSMFGGRRLGKKSHDAVSLKDAGKIEVKICGCVNVCVSVLHIFILYGQQRQILLLLTFLNSKMKFR